MTRSEVFAPAKVNLTLHVTGRRPDGYHLLDSLVVFTGLGDRLTLSPAPATTLEVTGPMAAGVPVDGRNLCLRAAALFDQAVAIGLEKHLPAAGGIGGGSSDAAAVIRVLRDWTGQAPDPAALLDLGADLPVCLDPRPQRMAGIGERLTPVPGLPECWLVLVNAGVEVPTGAVFSAMTRRDNPPMADLPGWRDARDLAGWLAQQRNDLESPARAVAPVIDEVLAAIGATPGCLLSRMSGSGGTCFGLYAGAAEAEAAARQLGAGGWWAQATGLFTPR
ncbi:4-(cytidine 5'-diphospho)-2-C-methyl-D-erythritol kinase [Aquicoccus sp. SCR17]|nr:4-(cytidine 5'-diphospho)-2-C-methyl-D-erythritol kinase [Carideicomes alvinocaridis]